MKRFSLIFPVLYACLLAPNPASAEIDELLMLVPGGANTLVLFDKEAILASPLAMKEGWRQEHEKAFASGLTMMPPEAKQFVMVSKLDLQFAHASWQAAVMNLYNDPDMSMVAAKHGGFPDKLDRYDIVELRTDTFVAKLRRNIAGVLMPANRQELGGWLTSVERNTKPALTTYLAESASFAKTSRTPIILALDFRYSLSPTRLQSALYRFDCLKDREQQYPLIAEILSDVRGVTLGIKITDRPYGAIKVDFANDMTLIKDIAKPLLLEILAKRGMMIEEMKDWKVTVTSKQVRLDGTLGKSGMQRIFSLLDRPPSLQKPTALSAAKPNEPVEESLVVLASKQYFSSITRLVDDLRHKRDAGAAKTVGEVGLWYEKYARRIDRLPILNVDDELLEFGQQVADALRDASMAIKGIGANSASRRTGANGYSGSTRWSSSGWYGNYDMYSGVRAAGQERAAINTQERVKGFSQANQIKQDIDSALAEMRKKLTKKYKVEF